MTLDLWLVARLAKDLSARIEGARIQSLLAAGDDLVFFCYRRGTHVALHIRVDSGAPLVAAYESSEPLIENGSDGWTGGVAALLRGAVIDSVHAVPNDRVLYIDVSSRSAFGLPSRSRIVIELQPRKANALVLRPSEGGDWIVVAAAKQFNRAQGMRSLRTGAPYEPPPRPRPRLDRAQFIVAMREIEANAAERAARLLGEFDPECTPSLARETVFRAARSDAPAITAHVLLDVWAALRREVETALEESGDVFVARREGKAVVHLVALTWAFEESAGELRPPAAAWVRSVNELCAEALALRPSQRSGLAPAALRKRLATMLARCEEEQTTLESVRRRASEADHLREAGDAIYAHLTAIARGANSFDTPDGRQIHLDPRLTAKENAAEYFRKYKKAHSGLPRIEARLDELRANREYWDQLLWELERAGRLAPAEREPVLAEIATALGIKERKRQTRRYRVQVRRQSLSSGATAFVGRSPKENERLTFSIAGPNDWWFHARGIPGAHVIVKSGRAQISSQEIEEAAALAAGNSRASESTSVEVDFTQRKHVRRHASGRPGLVSYTDHKSVRVRPNHG